MSRQDAAEKHSQMPMSLQQISGNIQKIVLFFCAVIF
jgi:hypothetical protein